MNKMKILLPVLLLAVTFLFAGVASANHAWGKYHWNLSTADTTADPLVLGNNLTTANWNNSLAIASDDWNDSVLKNEIAPGISNSSCDPVVSTVQVCNGEYGQNGWLGIAQIWTYRGKNKDHIGQGVVKLNDTYYNLPSYNTAAWRNLVMCQEIGHTFGLDHQDEVFNNANLGTCMDYTDDPSGDIFGQLNNEHPNAHDYAMLADIYAHVNGGGSDEGGNGNKGNGKGRNGGNLPSQALGQSDWGQTVSFDAKGKADLYRRDLGNGFTVYTHVTWLP